MAKATTDEQATLRRRARRRLIGAMALATVIAVVLPWVLEGEPQQTEQDVSIQIPSLDAPPFEPKRVPDVPGVPDAPGKAADADTAAPPASTGASADEPHKSTNADEPRNSTNADEPRKAPATQEKPAAAAPSKDKPAAPAASKDKTDASGKQFVVQVTALADADKAAAIRSELADKGLKVYTEKIKTASGDVTRVRIGPFPDREAAEKERGRLKSLGFDGNVAPR